MRFTLVLLVVGCGNPPERREPPPSEPPVAIASPDAPAPCKNGEAICAGDDVMMCEGGDHRKVSSCRGGCKAGACIDTCGANDVELIYLVSSNRTLLSFDPRKPPRDAFRKIGELSCDPDSSPHSMAVDRTGIAWIGYHSGALYHASLLDARCFSQAAPPEGAPSERFGMGFVTDGPKATTEKLYVVEDGGNSEVATIDTTQFPTRWVRQGRLPVARQKPPELSGTSEGRLYGYFPGDNDRGFVQEIDRKGRMIGRTWQLPRKTGEASGWAFAFWGGVFYVFLTFEGVNEVHTIHRKTGKHQLALPESAYKIVGAGVSTCAPLLEKPL